MDRRRGTTRTLAAATLVLVGGLALAAEPPRLRALGWIDPAGDAVAALAFEPPECLRPPATQAEAQAIEIGRAAFRTPLLLGGQAARAGLSCESCHQAGRGNPHFRFPGASGAAGTADVTLSLFSTRRGNGVFDPVPIPDLTGPRSALKVAPDALPEFIRGLVVEEFDGAEPPVAVLNGLSAYVRALDPAACPSTSLQPVTAARHLDEARRAAEAAETALAASDAATALLMLAAARARLGLVDERFASLPAQRRLIRARDADLAAIQAQIRAGQPDAIDRLDTWRRSFPRTAARIAAAERQSLYDPERLADEAANRRLRGPPT